MAWLRKRIFSFGMVLALGFLLLVSMTVQTLLQLAFAHLAWLLPMVGAIVTWLIYALAFALMFHYLPDRRVGWRYALVGGVITASLFVLGRAAIGWYLERCQPGRRVRRDGRPGADAHLGLLRRVDRVRGRTGHRHDRRTRIEEEAVGAGLNRGTDNGYRES